MKSVKFLYNPRSGEGTILEYLDDIIHMYQQKGLKIIPFRLGRDHTAARMLEDVNENDYHHVLIAGGDGTINSVVNEMMQKGLNIPIAILPTGTANDFARLFGMSYNIRDAIRQILDGEICPVDLGRVNDRYFINVLSCGLFTEVSQKTPTLMKNTFGKLAYYLSSVQELPKFHKIHIRVESEEYVYDDSCLVFFVFNGRTAGNMRVGYMADARDGLLDVLILKGDNIIETVRAVFHFLSAGTHKGMPSGVVHFKTKNLKLSTPDNLTIDIDGEGGVIPPVEIHCLEGGIRMICPPQKQ